MSRISLYTTDNTISPSDKIIGSDGNNSNQTKNFTIAGLASYFDTGSSSSEQIVTLRWGNLINPLFAVQSTYIPNTIYQKLQVDFNGIDLNDGKEYYLVLERWKSARNAYYSNEFLETIYTYQKGGYRQEATVDSIQNNRLSEIQITQTEGQLFDFKWDRFFKSVRFPTPTGESIRSGKPFGSIPIAFRIKIVDGLNESVTPIIANIRLVAQKDSVNNINVITFKI